MEQYIKKSALVAEIDRRIEKLLPMVGFATTIKGMNMEMAREELKNLRSFINTLEVNEVDLEKEATEFVQTKEFVESKESPVLLIAKYFYELGLKAQKGE